MITHLPIYFFFFFNDTATTEIYTLSLHDALPIYADDQEDDTEEKSEGFNHFLTSCWFKSDRLRSEEHTSELQSRLHLVCRLLLEKKKKNIMTLCLSNSIAIECTKSGRMERRVHCL